MAENTWPVPLDPHSLVQYEVSWEPLLTEESDSLVSHVFTLPSDAIAAGLEIVDHVTTTYGGIIWLEVNAAEQDDEIFDGEGTVFGLGARLVTGQANRHDRTINLRVQQR